jgi:hypothetical protein
LAEERPTFEIIQDDPPQQKRKRKPFIPYLYLPWRWMAAAFASGAVVVVAGFLVLRPTSQANPVFITATPYMLVLMPTLPPTTTEAQVASGTAIRDMAEAGGWLAVIDTASLRLYQNGALIRVLKSFGNSNTYDPVAVAFSPDGQRVAALLTDYGYYETRLVPQSTLLVWDVLSGEQIYGTAAHAYGYADFYFGAAIAFSPDGRWLATGAGDGWINLWDMTTFEAAAHLNTLATGTHQIAFNGDSTRLTAITRHGDGDSFNYESAEIQVWDIHDLHSPQQLTDSGGTIYWPTAQWAALSANGRYAAFFTRTHELEIRDLEKGSLVGLMTMPDTRISIEDITINAAGDLVAFAQREPIDEATPLSTNNQRVIVRALYMHLSEGSVASYEDLSEPKTIGYKGAVGNDAYRVQLNADANILRYITGDFNHLVEWDLGTGETRTMCLC